jgi:hypothetical protein
MIRALKGAFMGYIGLLLNAPYKIDRMMGCVCGYSSLVVSLSLFSCYSYPGYMNQGVFLGYGP